MAPKRHCPRFEDCSKVQIDLSQTTVRIGAYLEGKHDAKLKFEINLATLQSHSQYIFFKANTKCVNFS